MSYRTSAVILTGLVLVAAPVRGQHSEEPRGHTITIEGSPPIGPAPDLVAVARRIVERTNEFRKTERRTPVGVDAKLAATTKDFAEFMARTDEYGHEADGSRPPDRATKHGYEYALIAENIATVYDPAGFTAESLADQFVAGWQKSPPHRRNMLDPDVTETGVAVARSEKTGHYYAVQMFGRPKAAAVEFRVRNAADATFEYTVGAETFTLPPRYTRTHTVGRPEAVRFRWPGATTPGPTETPATGDRFVVTNGAAGWAVKKN